MSREIPFSKPGTAPRKKRREPVGEAIRVCVREGNTDVGSIFECAKTRNGPWSKRVYTRAESTWIQAAHFKARQAAASIKKRHSPRRRTSSDSGWRLRAYRAENR